MDARETAHRHGGYVVAGNMAGVMADFQPAALQAFGALGKMPPRPTTKYEVLEESEDGDQQIYAIRYSNDNDDSLTIRSYWEQVGDDWKIVKAEPVE